MQKHENEIYYNFSLKIKYQSEKSSLSSNSSRGDFYFCIAIAFLLSFYGVREIN